ncbi:c-type cytochrome [Jiella pacifica]|uniref:C-type cytochrome n=1 Tax=Jiella pacifica TaxID=2696469 RepID=A0A6N9T5Y4_9HYPH|nr:cytochrome c [Jiella pacifica]NDW05476.1 c-type cytochrome [Jiella pacifica]
MHHLRVRLAAGLAAIATVCAIETGQAQDGGYAQDAVSRGHELAVANCSRCHAVGATGASPNLKAPPFRTLSERFPIDALEETFIGTIDTGHEGMPVFTANQSQIDDIIAYIASVME